MTDLLLTFLIIALAAAYAGWHVCNAFRKPDTPCSHCDKCKSGTQKVKKH